MHSDSPSLGLGLYPVSVSSCSPVFSFFFQKGPIQFKCSFTSSLDGRGPVNPKGLQFYKNFIHELVSHGNTLLLHMYIPLTILFSALLLLTGLLNLLLLQELNHMLHCTITTIPSLWKMSMEDGSTAKLCRLLKVPFYLVFYIYLEGMMI